MAAAVGGFQFSAEPRAVTLSANNVQGKRPKYREPEQLQQNQQNQQLQQNKANLMYDKRVIRGNTYAQPTVALPINQTAVLPQQRSAQKGTKPSSALSSVSALIYPSNSGHMSVQTEDYLEELADEIFEHENSTQTDPSTQITNHLPRYIVKPAGIDAATAIEPGELFDFDTACEPLLEVLIGKTLEISLTEALEEQELALLRAQRERFVQERNALLAETQRLEAAALRKEHEKELRMAQEKGRLAAEKEIQKKLAAARTAKQFMSALHASVIDKLEREQALVDPVKDQIEAIFVPQLLSKTLTQLQQIHGAKATVNQLIGAALEKLSAEKQRVESERESARLAESARIQAEAEAKRQGEIEAKRAKEEARLRAEEEERKSKEEEERLAAEEDDEEEEEEDEDN
jgi:hypothetical protein